MFIYLSIYLSIYLFIYLFIYLNLSFIYQMIIFYSSYKKLNFFNYLCYVYYDYKILCIDRIMKKKYVEILFLFENITFET